MMENTKTAISIDIGGTNTKLGLITQEGKILGKSLFPTQVSADAKVFLEQLVLEIKKLIGWVNSPCKVAGIGVGAPNANFYTGIVEGAANLRWQGPVHLQEFLQEAFCLPVFLTNDASLAALGEKRYGGAQEMDHFISVTLGTGVGCGIFMNGSLLHGHNGLAGELGHTSLRQKGRSCKCGKRGCLETYVSIEGIRRTAFALMADQQEPSPLRSISCHEINPREIYRLALGGDPLAKKVYDFTGKKLGYKLADLIALFNPEAVFLSGGLSNSGNLLRVPALEAIEKCLYKSYKRPLQLIPSKLNENEISLLGGAALVWEHLPAPLSALLEPKL